MAFAEKPRHRHLPPDCVHLVCAGNEWCVCVNAHVIWLYRVRALQVVRGTIVDVSVGCAGTTFAWGGRAGETVGLLIVRGGACGHA